MNKSFLIILLAVCLVSVHAFVKRDAPAATTDNIINSLEKNVKEFADNFGKNFKDALDPENIKKAFNEAVDKATQAFNTAKAKEQ